MRNIEVALSGEGMIDYQEWVAILLKLKLNYTGLTRQRERRGRVCWSGPDNRAIRRVPNRLRSALRPGVPSGQMGGVASSADARHGHKPAESCRRLYSQFAGVQEAILSCLPMPTAVIGVRFSVRGNHGAPARRSISLDVG